MDRIAPGFSRPVDTEIYEYRGDDFLPIDVNALGQEGMLFRPASASLDSDQLLSSQGTGSQQSSLPQNFYGTSSQQSSLSSSSQGVGVSVVLILCQSRNIDWAMAHWQEQGPLRQPFRRSVAQHLTAHWGNVCLLSFI